MPGVFQIHPNDGSTITCDTLDTLDTSKYCLMSQDLKEEQREKIIYSEGRFDGSVISSSASIITVGFTILVNGDTLDDISANLSVLTKAFSSFSGGYIEYRPIGYSSSVLTTYYKYLRSGPPNRLSSDVQMQSSSRSYPLANLYKFDVKVFSLATSDPDNASLVEVATTTSTGPFLFTLLKDGDSANVGLDHLDILSTNIKGDGFFPLIRATLSHTNDLYGDVRELFVHVFKVDNTSTTDEFLWEASHTGSYTDSGRYVFSSTPTAELVFFDVPADMTDVYGKVVPIFPYKITDGTWEYRISYDTITPTYLTEWTELQPVESPTRWDLEIPSSVNIPPFKVPEGMSISPDDVKLELRTTDSSSKTIAVYGMILLNVDAGSWIGKFVNSKTVDLDNTITWFALDSHRNMNYLTPFSLSTARDSWDKSGDAIGDMILQKEDYRVRILANAGEGTYAEGWYHGGPNALYAQVLALFHTIYPFSE